MCFKGSRGHKNQLRPLRGSRSSITGTARLIRRRLSQKDHKISAQSSLRTQKNLERSDTDLRIKVSRLGTILSGVDNRFLSAKRVNILLPLFFFTLNCSSFVRIFQIIIVAFSKLIFL